jgi:hypothetical protein
MDTLENAQKRAEYWKASTLDATREIEELRAQVAKLESLLGSVGEKTPAPGRGSESRGRTKNQAGGTGIGSTLVGEPLPALNRPI